jgi:hypothetical protein
LFDVVASATRTTLIVVEELCVVIFDELFPVYDTSAKVLLAVTVNIAVSVTSAIAASMEVEIVVEFFCLIAQPTRFVETAFVAV